MELPDYRIVFAFDGLANSVLNRIAKETLLPIVSENYFTETLKQVAKKEISLVNRWVGYEALNFNATHGDDFFFLTYCGLKHILQSAGIESFVFVPAERDYNIMELNPAKLRMFYTDVMGYNVHVYRSIDDAIWQIKEIIPYTGG